MKWASFLLAGVLSNTLICQAQAAGVELFGAKLANADRPQLRAVLKQNNLGINREDNRYWYDLYDPSAQLQGASELQVGYVQQSGRFAVARYRFESFMDTEQVKQIISMVSQKYGKPARLRGNWQLGEVVATWNMVDNMEIEVSRGWPETTTYLQYRHRPSHAAMMAEIKANDAAEERSKANRQGNAF